MSMIQNIIFIFFLSLLLSGCSGRTVSGETALVNVIPENQFTEVSEQPKLAMIIGRPSRVKFDRLYEGKPGVVYIAEWYQVKFRSFDVVFGEIESQKLSLELTAHGAGRFKSRLIFVLIDISDPSSPKGLWWGYLSELTCIIKGKFDLLRKAYEGPETEDFFNSFKDLGRTMCAFTGR